MSESERSVELSGGSPWGFSIQGGADFRAPLKVTKVSPGGKAELAGVQVNDFIREICGKTSSSLRHSEALFLIRTAGQSLPLILQKGGSSLAPYLPPKQLIRSSTAPAPRSPRKKKISTPDKTPVVAPVTSPVKTEIRSHDRAMHKSSPSSGDEKGLLSSSGEENRARPLPQPIKAKPRSVSLLTPTNGTETSPPNPHPIEDKTPDPPETGAEPASPQETQETPKSPKVPATKKRSSKKKRELKPPPAEAATGLYDFTAETKHELSFKRGDTLQLLRTVDQNWLEARLGAKKGIIPVSYVELTPQTTTQPLVSGPQAVARFDFVPEETYELGFHKGDTIKLLSRVDDNWLQGRLGDTTGIFPAGFVNILVPIEEPPPATRNLAPVENEIRTPVLPESPCASSQGEGDLYRALYTYSPQNADELELEPGSEVHVIRKCEDGWFMGYHSVTGAFGTFPGNYVQLV